MNALEITRKFTFDAGHRVLGHEGHCRFLHGHTYAAEVSVRAACDQEYTLDQLGRVIDFSVIKERIGKWIENNWDHNLILNPDDPLLMIHEQYRAENEIAMRQFIYGTIFNGRWPYVMPASNPNPTVENMAKMLFDSARMVLVDTPVTPRLVRLYETPSCWADYYAPHTYRSGI